MKISRGEIAVDDIDDGEFRRSGAISRLWNARIIAACPARRAADRRPPPRPPDRIPSRASSGHYCMSEASRYN